VTTADLRRPTVVAKFATAVGCVLDVDVEVEVDVDVDVDSCSRCGQLSGGVASTPLNSARSARKWR
jgi:hypothetical protein